MKRAQKLFGQKMHVFDIRKHEMVICADAFYQPKPGTDLVWLGAATKYIIDNDLHDKAFLNDWVDNYEDYYKSLELFTMDFAEETTGIPKEQIISFAEEVAKPNQCQFVGQWVLHNKILVVIQMRLSLTYCL